MLQCKVVSGRAKSDADYFRHYVEKHRPNMLAHIAGSETVDHPSAGQLLALARIFFLRKDRVAGIAGRS